MITRDDLFKIENWLQHRTVRDSQLKVVEELDGSEMVPLVQDGENKVARLYEVLKKFTDMTSSGIYNVSNHSDRYCISLEEAIRMVPVDVRNFGLIITFYNKEGNWEIYQFKGESRNQWQSTECWKSIIEGSFEELVVYPDEEDTTGVKEENRTYIKLKDKAFIPEDFSGLGRIILRKNLIGTQACSIDDEDHYLNLLTQEMINQPNTIYIVQYDFDLNGKTISIPKNSILWFQGGSLNNGTVYVNEAAILGVYEFADMGNCNIFGNFHTGQIMTFRNKEYKLKESEFYTKDRINGGYIENPRAYTTVERQELRWWNGEEWLLILDITDYTELKSIILDLCTKHNFEISALYTDINNKIDGLDGRVETLEDKVKTLEDKVPPVINYNDYSGNSNRIYQLEEVIQGLPKEYHIDGLIVTFLASAKLEYNEEGSDKTTWETYQFKTGRYRSGVHVPEQPESQETIQLIELEEAWKDPSYWELVYSSNDRWGTIAKFSYVDEQLEEIDETLTTIKRSIEGFEASVKEIIKDNYGKTLTIKDSAGGTLGTFNGTEDIEVAIPASGSSVPEGLEDRINDLEGSVEDLKDKFNSLVFLDYIPTITLEEGQQSVELTIGSANAEGNPSDNTEYNTSVNNSDVTVTVI